MAEYIDKEAVLSYLNKKTYAYRLVKIFPISDVVPVKHGRWLIKQLDNFRKCEVSCSNCGWVGIENYDSYNDPSDFEYCPYCGAKMDLENR